MAKFLNARKAVIEIEDLMKEAGEILTLISPYLKLSKDFMELLNYRNSKEKVTTVIFGKTDLNPTEMMFLQDLRFVILKYNEDVHANCYVNDDKIIMTSLNLYDFSMMNNKEMGVLVYKNDEADEELFEDAITEVDFIDRNSKRYKFTAVFLENEKVVLDDLPEIPGKTSNSWLAGNKLKYKKEKRQD
jgi:hypothetical protein